MVELNDKFHNEDVNTLRKMLIEKYESEDAADIVHPKDLERLKTDDNWLLQFLDYNNFNVDNALKHFWNALIWRKKVEIYDICEENVRMEYLVNSHIHLHGRDIKGKMLLTLKCCLHSRGSKNMDDLKRCLLYWIERAFRETKNDQITLVFDCKNLGLSHFDIEFTSHIITTLKNYYPSTLNWILVFDMPWTVHAPFQIIKKLLPKKGVEILKFINAKNVRQYIDEDNMPREWGGKDDYVFSFVPETRQIDEVKHEEKTLHHSVNNNNTEQTNLNVHKKVHFANNLNSESPSPLSDISSSSFETRHDMLQLSPAETIIFQKNTSNNELIGNVHILNVSKKAVTYKVKTTAPDKYRVRPSSGTLSPITSANISVVIQKNQQIQSMNKDKFLVMCMALPDGEPLTADEIANMWKEVTANSPEVEQHRLKCTMPPNVTTAIINNAEISLDNFTETQYSVTSSMSHNGTKQSIQPNQQHLQATINHLSETVSHLNQQVKTQQSLQWITIFIFVILSIVIVYILKMEIQNSNSQYCIDK